jgi:hypothetical protein
MASLLGVAGAGVVVGAVVTAAVLAATVRLRDEHGLASFRCRVRSVSGRRGRRGRWELGRGRAVWVGNVLLIRRGLLRLRLTPLYLGVGAGARVRRLGRGEVSGLGPRPVSLRFLVGGDGGVDELEIAVAGDSTERLIGPFLTTAMTGLPLAPHERGA